MQDLVKTHFQLQALAGDSNQHRNRGGGSDLSLQCFITGPAKPLDSQVLLDPFVEQFHFRPRLGDLGYRQLGKEEVIREELQSAPVLDIQVTNAWQGIRISLRRFEVGYMTA